MGGAKALRLDRKIGSITPGKQADLAMFDTRGMNLFAILPGGDPVHAVVMNAEAADVDAVMVAGEFLKRDGKLVYPESQLRALRSQALESRQHLMRDADYVYQPFPQGPLPERYIV
jgi:cytosine/adenosine deaminase-related metal-dependent hydrolase